MNGVGLIGATVIGIIAGWIASQLTHRDHGLLTNLLVGLVGALLVLVADLVGQFAFDNRFPVGVITGALGAPYLVFLLIRINRSGGSL